MSESSSGATLDDPWVFAGPISCPPIRGVVHFLDGLGGLKISVKVSVSKFFFSFSFFAIGLPASQTEYES